MNANDLSRHYGSLTPEERFKLIVAAGARGDEAEQERLIHAGGHITLRYPDHAPYARAFDEVATLFYIELLEDAARYLEFLERADNDALYGPAAKQQDGGPEAATDDEPVEAPPAASGAGPAGAAADLASGRGKVSLGERCLRLALAAGYVLRTKAAGWQRFCEQLPAPPWTLWALYPGYERLQRALALAEEVAFEPEGFVRWLNEARPQGQPAVTTTSLTVAGIAEATAEAFRQVTRRWGGRD